MDLYRKIARLKDAIEADPDDTSSLYELGSALESLGQFDDAIVQFKAIVCLEPDDHESLHAIGRLFCKMRNAAQAVEYLRRAIELWKEQPDYFADLGDALYMAGDFSSARDAYEKALSLTLPNEDVQLRVAAALQSMN